MDKDTRPVGVAVVGCGTISAHYAKGVLARANELNIVGAYDRVSERSRSFVGQFGGCAFESMSDLLASPEVEALVNLTVPTAHAEVTRLGLEAGKHVYCEKPVAATRDDASQLVRIAKERNLLFGSAPCTMLGEAQQTLWKAVRDGMIGDVFEITADMTHGRPERIQHSPKRYYSSGGGPMLDVGCYPMSVLTTILGPVRAVTGMSQIRVPQRTRETGPSKGKDFTVTVPDHVLGLLRFADGVIGKLSVSFIVDGSTEQKIEVYGTRGFLRLAPLTSFGGQVSVCSIGKTEWRRVEHVAEPSSEGLDYSRGLADVAAAVRAGDALHCTGEQASHNLDVCLGILESAEIGRELCIESTFERPKPIYG